MTTPSAEINALEDLTEGRSLAFDFVVNAADMADFSRISGDYNPLHTDAEFARGRGFSGPVVYGALLVANVSRLIGMHFPGQQALWSGLRMTFRNPLMVDEPARLEAVISHQSVATSSIKIKITIRAGDKLIASGSAESMVLTA